MRIQSSLVLVLLSVGAACGGESGLSESVTEESLAAMSGDFDVEVADCSEFAGIGFVPRQNAAPLVPAGYTLAGTAESAVIVVRTASCASVSVDGKKPRPGTVSQIGISLVGPDASADINNYTLYYTTDNALLHAKLTAAGLDAVNEHDLLYSLAVSGNGGTLDIASGTAQTPSYGVSGSVIVPTSAPTAFTASWWQNGRHGVVRSRTVFPDIRFSGATMTLTTPSGSALAALIGGTSLVFPLLDSHNAFASAHMEVRNLD
jgi:hypothetical protein